MRVLKYLFCAAAFTLLTSGVVSACTCVLSTPAEDFISADAIFIGKVISVDDRLGAKFLVLKSWKLVDTDSVVVYTTDPREDGCAYVFQEGESYMVYAGLSDGKLRTGQCWATAPLIYAGDPLKDMQGRTEVPLTVGAGGAADIDGRLTVSIIAGVAGLLVAVVIFCRKMTRRRAA